MNRPSVKRHRDLSRFDSLFSSALLFAEQIVAWAPFHSTPPDITQSCASLFSKGGVTELVFVRRLSV